MGCILFGISSRAFFLGLPVSGLTIPVSVFAAHVQGPVWLTGGDYGPEGGLLATGAILLGVVYVSFAKSIYTSEEMKALVFAPAAAGRLTRRSQFFRLPPGKRRKETDSHVCLAFIYPSPPPKATRSWLWRSLWMAIAFLIIPCGFAKEGMDRKRPH